MEPPLRTAWDPKASAAEAPKQTHASAATERRSISRNKAEPLQAGLAPKLNDARSAEERYPPHAASGNAPRPPQPADDGHEHTVVVRSSDQASGDVLPVESGFRGLNRDSTTKRQNPASRSNIGLSEEALVRLEAAVRALREKERLSPPSRLIAAAEVGPSDSDGPRQGPDEIALSPPPARIGLCAQDMIAGTAIVAALGAAVLTYFFLASPGAKAPAGNLSNSIVSVAEPSPRASGVVPSPNVSKAAAEDRRALSSLIASAVTSQTTSAARNPELVFLRRPGVKIRSAPTGNAPVLGTAPRGTQFTPTGREGDWVQVENTRWKGWINSQFLAPDKLH